MTCLDHPDMDSLKTFSVKPSWIRFGIVIGLALGVAFTYWSMSDFGFVQFDDPTYVSANEHVLDGITAEGMEWAFSTFYGGNWHPITWLSHMIDVELFGVHPGAHHLVNLFLHLLNTLILFDMLHRMTGALWRSAFVAALFGLHPIHVESVAWVAERKDLLCTFFWFLATGAYLKYIRQPGRGRYAVVVLLFALALMAKPMAVTFPFTLLLLDYWPLNRFEERNEKSTLSAFRPLVVEKTLLFLMSLFSAIVTVVAQHRGGAVASLEVTPFSDRLANSMISYGAYLLKIIGPVDLAYFYPYPREVSFPGALLAAGVLAAITFLVIFKAKRRPFLPVGWFWYLGTLVPVIGLVQVGAQAMADRYMYIPSIGIFVMASWGMALLAKTRLQTVFLSIVALALLISSSVITYRQLQFWKSDEALFSRAIAVTRENWRAHVNLGSALEAQGKYEEAIEEYQKAGRIRPDRADILYNIAHVFGAMERWPDAMAFYRAALELDPTFAQAHYNLAKIYALSEDTEQALHHYREAVRLNPEFFEAYNDLGVLLFKMGKPDDASAAFQKALSIKPDYFEALNNLRYINQRMKEGASEE